jgi:transcriptional regulator with PAS, ATPase and Fis domain
MSTATTLLRGQSGTGKELIASAIHYHSNRSERPFVKLNCGALSTNLIESELFGHVKGAFTGAIKDKQGRFALADNGSIFLDEIGEVEASTQVKLLRIIQEGEYEKVGSDITSRVDVRLISATNKELKKEIKNKNFREDLYYRLNVISINLPPLRERGKDILLISDYFMKKYSDEYGKKIEKIDDDVKEYFLRYNWPGNVRELQNVLERAVVLCGGASISLSLIPQDIKEANISENYIKHGGKTLTEIVEEVEKGIIFDSLSKNNWVQTHTAEKLGITRSALQYKMQKYDLYKKEEIN